jgi:uncharacterized RDD family membrane protein YckC
VSDWPFTPGYAGRHEPQPSSAASRPSYVLAGWWSRVGAQLVDDLVLLVPFVVAALVLHQYHVTHYVTIDPLSGASATSTTVTATMQWVDWLLIFAYAAVLMTRGGVHNGQTLGTQRARLRVVRDDGQPVGLATVLIREALGKATVIAFVLGLSSHPSDLEGLVGLYVVIDYLWPLWESEKRALHDLIAGTHVVRLEDRASDRFTPAAL